MAKYKYISIRERHSLIWWSIYMEFRWCHNFFIVFNVFPQCTYQFSLVYIPSLCTPYSSFNSEQFFFKFLTCLISLSDLMSSSQPQLKLSINKILTNFFLQRVKRGKSFRFFTSVSGGLRSEVKVKKNYPTKLEPLYLDKSSIYTAYVNSTFIVNVAFVLLTMVEFMLHFFSS